MAVDSGDRGGQLHLTIVIVKTSHIFEKNGGINEVTFKTLLTLY